MYPGNKFYRLHPKSTIRSTPYGRRSYFLRSHGSVSLDDWVSRPCPDCSCLSCGSISSTCASELSDCTGSCLPSRISTHLYHLLMRCEVNACVNHDEVVEVSLTDGSTVCSASRTSPSFAASGELGWVRFAASIAA